MLPTATNSFSLLSALNQAFSKSSVTEQFKSQSTGDKFPIDIASYIHQAIRIR